MGDANPGPVGIDAGNHTFKLFADMRTQHQRGRTFLDKAFDLIRIIFFGRATRRELAWGC